MHKLKIYLSIIFLSFISQLAEAQTFEIRAHNDGMDNNIHVQMRATASPVPTTADGIADIVFGLKWLDSNGADLGTFSGDYQMGNSDNEVMQATYEFQAFGMTDIQYFPAIWTLDEWITIMTVPVSMLNTNSSVFEICEVGFHITTDPNINVVVSDVGQDFTPIINGSATIDESVVDNDGDNIPNSIDCDPNDASDATLVLNDNPIANGTYTATNKIESAALVNNSGMVDFKATLAVNLKPGFTAQNGAQFLAKIENICDPALAVALVSTNVSCFDQMDGQATANSTGGDGNYTYAWSNGATTSNISMLPTGNYSVTVTDGGSQTATASVTISIDNNDADMDGITDGCDCDPNDGSDATLAVTDDPLQAITYSADNKMTVIGTATGGTTLKASIDVRLLPGFIAQSGSQVEVLIEDVCVPPAPLIWEGEIEEEYVDTDAEVLASESETLEETEVILFPNPTSGLVQIRTEMKVEGFSVFDMIGKEYFRGAGTEIDLKDLAGGVYLIRIYTNEKEISKLIIKE